MTDHGILLHGFGLRYDLPISLALYLYAAAAVVVLSFVLVVLFAGDRMGSRAVSYPRVPAPWLLVLGRSAILRGITGTIGVLGLLAIIVTGLFGSQDPVKNPAEYLIWIYFWVGLVLLSGLLGNLWTLFNPWAALFDLLTVGRRQAPWFRMPDRLGIWPAAFVYLCFAFLELASGTANRPWLIATLAVGYSALTLVGMGLFGRNEWLSRCEGFTVLFSVVGRFGPVETERDEEGRLTGVWLRPWGAGLLQAQRAGWDWIVFVVLMLSTLAFDGLLATPTWRDFSAALLPAFEPLGGGATVAVRTIGLVLLASLFLLVFNLFVRLMLFLAGARTDDLAAITAFALTLVPIALVYNAAHYYSYLVIQSQALLPLLADPFGRGWDLVPTRDLRPSWALAGAATVWYLQVTLIVLGHVIAVLLAHLRAGERFGNAQKALLSQYPMLVLMVLYTMTSLWILAQPTTRELG